MTETAPAKTPWHLWLVGGIALFWNGFGAYDYAMTQFNRDAHLRSFGMSDEQITYYAAMPWWAMAIWAIGTWGALIGTVLLLARSKWALPVFIISFAAFLLSLVYTHVLSGAGDVAGADLAISGVITLGCIFFIWYAWMMKKRGVLR